MIYVNTRVWSPNAESRNWKINKGRTDKVKRNTKNALMFAKKPKEVRYILFTYHGPRKLDGDNLQRAFKYVRDLVAKWLGIDDGKTEMWRYAQSTGKNNLWRKKFNKYGFSISFPLEGGE